MNQQNDDNNKEVKIDDSADRRGNKEKRLHTTIQIINAVFHQTPYKKEKLAMPRSGSQMEIAIREYDEWERFFQPKIVPKDGDWLQAFPEDKAGQSFNDWYRYIKQTKIYATLSNPAKNSIGLISCGSFNMYLTKQLYPFIDILSEMTQIYYFGINIDFLGSMSTKNIAFRYNGSSNNKQLKTTSIQDKLKVIKNKHDNLCCLMGISILDLYPDDTFNFVFGEASIMESVGIFSFFRYFPRYDFANLSVAIMDEQDNNDNDDNDDNDKNWLNTLLNEEEHTLFIRRCLGVLLHEIGHLFGLDHCPYFECLMNGANHLIESDKAPLHLCPVCLHKLYFGKMIMEKAQSKQAKKKKGKKSKGKSKYLDILKRYQQLSILYLKYGLHEESKWCAKRAQFIRKSK